MKKIASLFCVLALALASFTAAAQQYELYPRGDVSEDGRVDIDDVSVLINYLLTGKWPAVETITVNGVSFKMIGVEGGTFMMGASNIDGGDPQANEFPAHEVTVSSFSIGQTEVTQELWMAVMGDNPSYCCADYYYTNYDDDFRRPVEMVSWYRCKQFIDSLNKLTGRHFRFPTEAEWEFAARGGNKSEGYKYAGSNNVDEVSWHQYNCYRQGLPTQPVGTKKPNELGLYDMSGNVYEWVQDWMSDYTEDAQVNPTGPRTGTKKIFRGGAWDIIQRWHRCATRVEDYPDMPNWFVGLRLAESAQ
jgi:formylglycine-generating enzyme required for sulfatase activity